jgi:hypothetical protein
MTNPFCSHSIFNLPLEFSLCQQMHALALRHAAQGEGIAPIPESVPLTWLREQYPHVGPDIYLAHPATIEQIFCGVTLAVYQQIEALYCAPPFLSLTMITRVVERMAQCAELPAPTREAIWAICAHLEEQRRQLTNVTTHTDPSTWWLGAIAHDAHADRTSQTDHKTLVGVIDLSNCRVLAFRLGARRRMTDLCQLSLYDALAAARRPFSQGTGGLIWHVPAGLADAVAIPAPPWEATCLTLGMRIEHASAHMPFIEEVQHAWHELCARAAFERVQLAVAFDSVLHRAYGYSPLRTREQAAYQFRHRVGYGRDPASLVPALRALLPQQEALISQEGEIFLNGLHYSDELLAYFLGSHVAVQRSEQTEAVIWVSLDGEILTQALARELVRRDGSYRLHRPDAR